MLYDVVAVLFTISHTGTSEHGVCSHGTARVSRKGNGGDSSRSTTAGSGSRLVLQIAYIVSLLRTQ